MTIRDSHRSRESRFTEEEIKLKKIADNKQLSLAAVGLSVRVVNTLESREIMTVEQLSNCTRDQLLEIDNFGEKTLVKLENPHPLDVVRDKWLRQYPFNDLV